MDQGGSMTRWIRFETAGKPGFGTLDGDTIAVHEGDMFAGAKPTSETLALSAVKVLTPTVPGKMLALWNNFHALAAKLNGAEPTALRYLPKAINSFLAAGESLRRHQSYAGTPYYEGEPGDRK